MNILQAKAGAMGLENMGLFAPVGGEMSSRGLTCSYSHFKTSLCHSVILDGKGDQHRMGRGAGRLLEFCQGKLMRHEGRVHVEEEGMG